MDWIIFGIVVVWLGIVSWFDVRKSEIPHSAWVVVPLMGAGIYRLCQGGWQLVLLTAVIAAASERERIAQALGWRGVGHVYNWYPLLILTVLNSAQTSPVATLAVAGFWLAWELKWWGGADAVASISITLIKPDVLLILVFLSVHVIATIVLTLDTLARKQKVHLHKIPGLPLLMGTVILAQIASEFLP